MVQSRRKEPLPHTLKPQVVLTLHGSLLYALRELPGSSFNTSVPGPCCAEIREPCSPGPARGGYRRKGGRSVKGLLGWLHGPGRLAFASLFLRLPPWSHDHSRPSIPPRGAK